MPSHHDSAGRPIVVVTGMGVVTSLGAGKADNWKNLTAGKSGIKNITRFATEGLKTRFAGTVDFVPAEPLSSPELSERLADIAADEAVAESGIGSRGDFPGPLFIAVPPIEIEWDQRRQVAAASGANANVSYDDLIRTAAPDNSRRSTSASCSARSPIIWPTSTAPRARRFRCRPPAHRARPRSSSASRRSAAAKPSAALCIGSDGSINPESLIRFSLLSALSTSSDPPDAGGQALRQEPRRLRHGRGRRRPRAGEPGVRHGARRENPRRHQRLRRDGRRLPPHAVEPGRQADHRLHPQCAGRRGPYARRTSTTSIRTAPARRRTTRWRRWASWRCSASGPKPCRCRPTSR